jgi:hypothetical protein
MSLLEKVKHTLKIEAWMTPIKESDEVQLWLPVASQ